MERYFRFINGESIDEIVSRETRKTSESWNFKPGRHCEATYEFAPTINTFV